MGIGRRVWIYEQLRLKELGLEYEGLIWCEFGDQINWRGIVAKKVYSLRGVDHVSIDLNGANESIALDIGKPLPNKFLGKFDVVTNYGTFEHVNNQFQCFKNMHDVCKLKGIMIHQLVLVGQWPEHCRYYYTEKFIRELARLCGYEIINLVTMNEKEFKDPKNVIMAVLKKQENDFISEEKFRKIVVFDTGDLSRTGKRNLWKH